MSDIRGLDAVLGPGTVAAPLMIEVNGSLMLEAALDMGGVVVWCSGVSEEV